MVYSYRPKGVCSRRIDIELQDGVIEDVQILGGCDGNSQGIIHLVRGCKAADVAARIRGIRCERKKTSCPDQLSIALEAAVKQEQNGGADNDGNG